MRDAPAERLAPPALDSLSGLILLGTLMDGVDDEVAIGRMALEAVPSLGGVEAVALELDGAEPIRAAPPRSEDRVFPVATHRGRIGVLRVRDRPRRAPVPDFPLEILARETARAIVAARGRADLAASERRYRQLVESSRDVVFALDGSGVLRFVSGLPVSGETPDVLGRDVLSFVAPGARARAAEWLAGLLATRRSEPIEVQLVRADATLATVVVKGVASFDDGGAVTGVIGTVADVTQQRREERRRAEMEEQLRYAQRMESLGQLTAGIAHDFNNLLTTIYGSSDLARSFTAGNVAATRELDEIRAAAERAGALTQKLLAFGRRQLLRSHELSLADVVRDAEPLLRRLISERIAIELSLAPGGDTCVADPQAVEQVLVNLCLNAQDAMPSGGTLRIATGAETFSGSAPQALPAGRYAWLEVSDDGVGMDEATLSRIFEPFFTTKSFGAASGLGLSTSWGIVGQSGGTILVTSAPGEGSTFRALLPAAGRGSAG